MSQVVPSLVERHPVHTFDGTAPAPDSIVVIDPGRVQQEFEGWGTSLCWFANIAGGFPDPLRTYLADLLFDVNKGLGMQICRYNIGGAGWGTLDVPNFRYGANVESFWGPEGQWDFSRDGNQRWMLLAARDRGACIFEAFSNSPPYWMTVSGHSSGNVFPWLDNLQLRYQDQFVHYLAEVVRWYHDTHGLTFRTIAPFNEPNTIYWWAGNNQEGCHFDVSTQNTIITKLAEKLEVMGLTKVGVGIAASDETSIDTAVLTFKGYTKEVKGVVSQYNTHSYLGSMRKELRDLVRPTGKRLWMSEFGCGSFKLSSMPAALELSSVIMKDLNVLQANAWIYWQAIENSEGGNWWGLMQVPFHTGRYIILGKQFYCLMQYSRFIRCDSTILHSSQPKSVVVAKAAPDAARPTQTQIVIVATNALSDYDVVNFDLTNVTAGEGRADERKNEGTATIDIHRTSVTENCQEVASMEVPTPLRFGCALRPGSITTFVVTFGQAHKFE
ncbi:g11296 [Coccomyxa elongata]